MKTPLLWIAVFGIYIIVLLWDGIRRVFKNNNAEEYYAAGRGVSCVRRSAKSARPAKLSSGSA